MTAKNDKSTDSKVVLAVKPKGIERKSNISLSDAIESNSKGAFKSISKLVGGNKHK